MPGFCFIACCCQDVDRKGLNLSELCRSNRSGCRLAASPSCLAEGQLFALSLFHSSLFAKVLRFGEAPAKRHTQKGVGAYVARRDYAPAVWAQCSLEAMSSQRVCSKSSRFGLKHLQSFCICGRSLSRECSNSRGTEAPPRRVSS